MTHAGVKKISPELGVGFTWISSVSYGIKDMYAVPFWALAINRSFFFLEKWWE